jgi:hypothetical protein
VSGSEYTDRRKRQSFTLAGTQLLNWCHDHAFGWLQIAVLSVTADARSDAQNNVPAVRGLPDIAG